MSRLFKRTLGFVVLLFTLISVCISIVSGWQIYRGMSHEFLTRGESIASIIADAAVAPILDDSPAALQSMIDKYLDIVGVAYILVSDHDSEIIVHTMVPGVPPALKRLVEQLPAGAHRFAQRAQLDIAGFDVLAPIVGGSAGYVVIGLDNDVIRDEILAIIIRQQVAIVGLLILSIAACYGFIQKISRPMTELADHARKIATIDPTELATISREPLHIAGKSPDEIGDLATSFSYMERQLSASIDRLADNVARHERIETELNVARDIQANILPDLGPLGDSSTFTIEAKMLPAREVGGDFYECSLVGQVGSCPGKLFIAIGDVSGKGVPAALFMSMACTLLRSQAQNMPTPEALMDYANRYLSLHNEACMFVTASCGLLDLGSGAFEYACAGHPPPLLLAADGRVSSLPRVRGVALGASEQAQFDGQRFILQPGDTLCLYTDGITEAADAYEALFGEGALRAVLASHGGQQPAQVAAGVLAAVSDFAGAAAQADDLTLLAVQFKP